MARWHPSMDIFVVGSMQVRGKRESERDEAPRRRREGAEKAACVLNVRRAFSRYPRDTRPSLIPTPPPFFLTPAKNTPPTRSRRVALGRARVSLQKPRRLQFFGPYKGAFKLQAAVSGDTISAVSSRNCFHRTELVAAGGNASGRVVIF